MAGNDGKIDVQYGLDVSQATAEAAKLSKQINGITGDLLNAQKTIEANLKRMTGDVSAALAKLKTDSAQFNAMLRREDRITGNVLTSQSRGGRQGQITDAAGRAIIADAKNSADQVTARITDALVSAYSQRLRTLDDAVAARLRSAEFQNARLVRANSPANLAVRETLDRRAEQQRAYSAQYGQGALANRNTLDRLSSNGGADIVAVQARILAGYTALSAAFNSLRGMATFVVDLDKEFIQFQAITATTNTEMETLKNNLIEVAEASKFSAVEIAQAATILGQAGLSAREVAESINAVQLLATAAGTDLNEAVDVVTSTMSIFNLQTSQTVDVANTLTAALNLSKLTIDKLTLGFQYAGNIAAQVGITYQELTGVLGALANSGIRSGSTLGTGLRQLIIDIQNPTEKFRKVLEQLKLTEQDVNIESNGLLPVLRTLKDAGFGTAEAFESFEVRAAASYAALSNNTELAAQLQQQFTLSTAAIEANNVQMESLTNTFTRFASVVGTQAYRAFQPFVRILQDAIKVVTDFITTLDKIPGLLQVSGAVTATVGTALTISAVSALIRGLTSAIPLVGTLTGAIGGATVATVGLGTAAGTTTGLVSALFTVIKAHPFILLASLLVGAVTLMNSFGDSSLSAAERIDVLKAQVNEFRGQTDAANDQIVAINQTIENLTKQKAALDKDPLIRSAKILEVKQGFKEISDEVSTTTGTVEELIAALRDLAQTDFGKMTVSIGAALQANNALIEGYKLAITEQLTRSPSNIRGTANTVANLIGNETPFLGDEGTRDQNLIAGYATIFGEKFAQYAAMAMNRMPLPADISETQNVLTTIGAASSSLTSQQATLRNKQLLGTITPEEAKVLATIPDQLALLNVLKDNLSVLVQARLNISATELENEILKNDQLKAQVSSSAQYTSLAKNTDALGGEINARYNELLRANAGKPAADAIKSFQALETEFKNRVADLATQADMMVEELAKQTGADPAKIREILNEVINAGKSLGNRISTKINTENVEFQKLEAARLSDEMQTLDDGLNTYRKQLSRSNTAQEFDAIRKFLIAKFDQKRKLLNQIYAAKGAAETDASEQANIQSELREKQKQVTIDEQQAIADLTQASLDQQVSAITETKAAIDDQISVTKDKLALLITAIGEAKPGPAMDALIQQFNTLSAALDVMANQSNTLGVQAGIGGAINKLIPETQAGRAQRAMQVLMSLGYSKNQAAGIVGNLVAESGMNPLIPGDGGQAFGLAQWHPDRRAELRTFAEGRGSTEFDFDTQLRFIDHELKKYTSFGLKELMATRSAGEAADVFRRLFERPTADPIKGQHGERIAYANQLAGIDIEGQANAANKSSLQLLNAQLQAQIQQINDRVTAAQNTLNAAKDPANAGNFTGSQITELERNLTAEQKAAQTAKLAAEEAHLAAIRRELASATAAYGAESEQALFWRAEEARVLGDVTAATNQKNAADAAMVQASPSINEAIQSATEAWMIQNGIIDQVTGKMIPLAKQVEATWGSVLDTLTGGFQNLFLDLVNGTMTAEEAFKKFALSVIDGIAQIIAKQLALQLVSSMFGGGTGGGGDFLSALLGVIPGSAQGEIINGTQPRDSVLRRLMPGEAVLKASTVSAVGKDQIQALNSLGNRSISASPIKAMNENQKEPSMTNVWVVSPDQVPPPGPNDIIAVVADNINRRGTLKQLIRSVATGT